MDMIAIAILASNARREYGPWQQLLLMDPNIRNTAMALGAIEIEREWI